MENIVFWSPEIPVLNLEKKENAVKIADKIIDYFDKKIQESDIIDCECGGSYTRKSKGGHYRSNAHRNYFSK